MKVKTGGPAFPHTEVHHGDDLYGQLTQGGMTLLDYFAAKAMQSLISICSQYIPGTTEDVRMFTDEIAEKAYDMAEFMIEEKARREDGD